MNPNIFSKSTINPNENLIHATLCKKDRKAYNVISH
jgi:hypothetical protein